VAEWHGGGEAVERMSERADTAYSPRFREEEHSATASQIVPRYEKGWVGVDIEAEM